MISADKPSAFFELIERRFRDVKNNADCVIKQRLIVALDRFPHAQNADLEEFVLGFP